MNIVGQGLPVLIALATMPVVVRGLGPSRFGVLALAWTVVGYMSVLDLGFGRATTKRVSEAIWAGDGKRVREVASTAAAVQSALGVASGIALWLLAPTLARVLLGGAEAVPESAAVLAVLAAAVPAVLISNAYRAVLEGLQRFDLVNVARAPLSAATFLVPFAGVLLGWGLVSIVAGLAVTRYAGAAVYLFLYRRAAPVGADRPSTAEFFCLLHFGGWVAVSNTVVPLVVYLERILVSALQGPVALAFYAAPQELVSKLQLIPAAIGSVLFPAFSGLAERGERPELVRRIRQGTRLVTLLLAPPAAILVLLAAPLLALWLGPEYGERSAGVMRVLAFAVFLNGLAFVPFALLEGVGRPDMVAKYHLLEFPLYATVVWWLVAQFGIMGAALGWALRVAITAPAFFLMALHHAGVGWMEPFGGTSGRALGAAVVLLAAAEAVPHVLTSSLGQVAVGIFLLGSFAVTAWTWLLDAEDRVVITGVWRRIRFPREETLVPNE